MNGTGDELWKREQMSWSKTRDRLDDNDPSEWQDDTESLGGWLLAGAIIGLGIGACVIGWLA